jgi:hypothetical protein
MRRARCAPGPMCAGPDVRRARCAPGPMCAGPDVRRARRGYGEVHHNRSWSLKGTPQNTVNPAPAGQILSRGLTYAAQQ